MSRLSIALLLVAMVSIQFGASLAKQLFPVLGPAGVTVLRTSFAAIFLLGLFRPWRRRLQDSQTSSQNTWPARKLGILALYGFALGAMNLTFYFSIQTIPLGMAVALEFVGPLALSLISSRRLTDLIWVVLAAIGIYRILPHSQFEAPADPQGVFFALCAGFFWALYIVFGKRAGHDSHPGQSTAIGMTFAALTALPFGITQSGAKLLNPAILPLGIAVALLSSALPYSIEMQALKKIPVKTFGILMSLEPVVATMMGALFLREHLTGTQLLSIACIVVASLGSSYSGRPSAPSVPPTPAP